MSIHDDLGTRMKQFYESVPKTRLVRRMPVAIRLDGRSFHTFTRGFKKPFDEILMKSMQETMKYLCKNIQGCVFGYTQSDEITLILVDYQTLEAAAWFDNEVQKICSVSASMATMAFNEAFRDNVGVTMACLHCGEDDDYKLLREVYGISEDELSIDGSFWPRWDKYQTIQGNATFDSRCFNIPKEEVTNLIYWRQLDAMRNSVQMVGQANFSHGELQGKSCNQIQDMLMAQKGINWNDFPTYQKRGSCCIKETYYEELADRQGDVCERTRWIIDKNIPIFKGDGRKYINKLIFIGDT